MFQKDAVCNDIPRPQTIFPRALTRYLIKDYFRTKTKYLKKLKILQVRKTTTKDPEAMPEILPKDTVKPGNCRDTYQMPMFTKMFCEQWIEEAEHVDNWFDSGKFQSSATL